MITIQKANEERFKVNIKVFGLGGGGCNAINNMIESELLKGVDFVAVNTDMQVLENSIAPYKAVIGKKLTNGLGAGGDPEIGEKAAKEDKDKLKDLIDGATLMFITTGMGGGTGTGSAPVVASIAKELDILTIAVVTKPFDFEGKKRKEYADKGIEKLKEIADATIIIPNQRLYEIEDGKIPLWNAFKMVDDVLLDSIRGLAELLDTTGVINVDFNDLRKVMEIEGETFIGIGHGEGENKAVEAAQEAIDTPLVEDLSMNGAEEILMNVIAGPDFDVNEMDRVVKVVGDKTGGYNNLKYGVVIDSELADKVKVTVVAKGFKKKGRRSNDLFGKNEKLDEIQKINPLDHKKEDFDTPAIFRRKVD